MALLDPGMKLFVKEVSDFFQNHLSAINPEEFFDKLLYDSDVQIPLLVVIAQPELKDDIVVKAYNAHREEVKKNYPERRKQEN